MLTFAIPLEELVPRGTSDVPCGIKLALVLADSASRSIIRKGSVLIESPPQGRSRRFDRAFAIVSIRAGHSQALIVI